MKVNNHMSQTNFGMALRINPDAKKFLESQGIKELRNLQKIGEDMKNYKHYNLEVGGNGYTIVPTDPYAQGYSDILYLTKSTALNNVIDLEATATSFADKGKRVKRSFRMNELPDVSGSTLLEDANCGSSAKKYAAATELLEKLAAKNAIEKAAKEAEQKAICEQAEDLISKFGVDA